MKKEHFDQVKKDSLVMFISASFVPAIIQSVENMLQNPMHSSLTTLELLDIFNEGYNHAIILAKKQYGIDKL